MEKCTYTRKYKNEDEKGGTPYGYARSSNEDGIKRQIEWLKDKGVKEVYIDKNAKVELNKLLNILKEGDTLITRGIDRITRDIKGLEEIIEFAKNKRVKFVLGDKIIDGINGVDPSIERMSAVLNTFKECEDKIVGIEE
ncbi:hypothetical protein 10S11_53 [uncultured Caudovirales phage]|uniref:Resolvase/invertase-type recombinase catalytic domain-containing protein n=1 Tax=uncultured Caudovirales phage TaxID=2100421 RepID=A0A2H4J078_9CAUD|nr:hypothetical protein 10S11_53 [uncultured Caudovirales phage]